MHTTRTICGVLLIMTLGSIGLSGCARTTVQGAHDPAFADSSDSAVLDFWHTLPGRSAVTNAEGLHGVLLFADGKDETGSYEARVSELKERGWIADGFDEAPDLAMTRGTLSKALAHAMDLQGGVMMRLTNSSPRYAARELVYLNVMAPSTDHQVISGLDYVGVIAKAQDYVLLREMRESEKVAKAAAKAPAAETDGNDAAHQK